MPGHGRRPARPLVCASLAALFGCGLLLPFCLNAQIIDWRVPRSWKNDAELTDLFFIDQEHGWVVGDRGLVLRTDNGGKDWRIVNLTTAQSDPNTIPVTCRLESVYFVSATHGWIAGGYSNPGSTTSIGVMYRTTDGGNSWKPLDGIALPKLNQVIFSNSREGLAVGDGNTLKPTGVFQTRDGGLSWSTAVEGSVASWQTACQVNDLVVVASTSGQAGRFHNNQFSPSLISTNRPVAIRELQMRDERFGLATGDKNQFMETRNGGLSWHPFEFPQGLPRATFDFRTLSVHGNRIWVAGSPGSRIYTMNTEEGVWRGVSTPVFSPMSRIRFINPHQGWAISQCGDIMHSADGGEHWSLQRRGTRGVAYLQIGDQPGEFIPEVFSKLSGDDNYIGGALLIHKDQYSGKSSGFGRLRQALIRVGASFVDEAWFPRQDGPVADQAAEFQQYLVRQIRTLRPRVIAIPSGQVLNDPLNLRAAVLAAVNAAANRNQFPDQISELGLSSWQVGKVVVLDRADIGSLKVTPNHYMMSLAALVTDHAMPSRMLLEQNAIEPRPTSITTIFTSPFAAGSSSTLFGSIENLDAEVPVRRGQRATAGNLVQMRQLSGKRKTIDRIMDQAPELERTPDAWSSGLAELTLQLEEAAAGVWLFELASRCETNGHMALALQTHLFLTSRLRKHPLSVTSYRWLYNYYSSAEQGHLALNQREARMQAAQIGTDDGGDGLHSRPVTRIENGIRVSSWEVMQDASDDVANAAWSDEQRNQLRRRRYQQARSVMQSFALVDPTALHSQRVPLSRIGLNRRLDPLISVENQLKTLAITNENEIGFAAMQEIGILNRKNSRQEVRNSISCVSVVQRPWLDGILRDPVWQSATDHQSMFSLDYPSGNRGNDRLLIAADNEFLFLAIRCRKERGSFDAMEPAARPRDSNLVESDRVEIAIDIDRDYQTCFLFCIDSAGKVAESIGDNIAWNPTWYVATRVNDDDWTAEIAIPLSEISTDGDFWAISVDRHIRNRLVSRCWQNMDWEQDRANGLTQSSWTDSESFHLATISRRSASHTIPLQAFRLVQMPWSTETESKTRDLPSDQ